MRSAFSLVIFMLVVAGISFSETIILLETTGDRITPTTNVITTNGGTRTVETVSFYGHSVYYTDMDFNLSAWHYTHAPTAADFWAYRTGTKITLSGTFQNKPVKREYTTANGQWYQCVDLALKKYAGSDSREQIFWTIRPTDLEGFEMIATRDGEESVKVNGVQTPSLRLKVTVTGLGSAFWSSSYWYRKSDIRYVRYEAYHGGPGTPLTIFEFISEEN